MVEGAGAGEAGSAEDSDGSGSLVAEAATEDASAVGVGGRTVGWGSAVLQAAGNAKSATAMNIAATWRHLPPVERMPGTIAA